MLGGDGPTLEPVLCSKTGWEQTGIDVKAVLGVKGAAGGGL